MPTVRHAAEWFTATPRNYHFFSAKCPECTARILAGKTRAEVENWYHRYIISQAAFEAYMHVWATGAFRFNREPDWERAPEDPEVIDMAAFMREVSEERKSG